MNDTDEYEQYLIDQIKAIQAEYQRAIQPHIDRLVELRNLRPMPQMIITMAQAKEFGLIPDAAIPASNKEQA